MFKSKNIPVDGTVLERERTVFKERNLFGRTVREVVEQKMYRNQGKILDSTSLVILKPTKRRIWQVIKVLLNIAEHIPVEIMVKDKEIVIRDGSKVMSEVEDVRRELKGHEVEV
jgi:hypothetical protein